MSLTKADLDIRLGDLEKRLETVIDEKLENKLDEKLKAQKEEIFEEMDNKLTNLRSDFFEKVDPILNEVTRARDERPLILNRIEKIEKEFQIQTSA